MFPTEEEDLAYVSHIDRMVEAQHQEYPEDEEGYKNTDPFDVLNDYINQRLEELRQKAINLAYSGASEQPYTSKMDELYLLRKDLLGEPIPTDYRERYYPRADLVHTHTAK